MKAFRVEGQDLSQVVYADGFYTHYDYLYLYVSTSRTRVEYSTSTETGYFWERPKTVERKIESEEVYRHDIAVFRPGSWTYCFLEDTNE